MATAAHALISGAIEAIAVAAFVAVLLVWADVLSMGFV
jgi:hypothetical protein